MTFDFLPKSRQQQNAHRHLFELHCCSQSIQLLLICPTDLLVLALLGRSKVNLKLHLASQSLAEPESESEPEPEPQPQSKTEKTENRNPEAHGGQFAATCPRFVVAISLNCRRAA